MKKTLLLLLLTPTVFAISETEFIQLLKKNNPFFATTHSNLTNLKIAKEIANPYQDWRFSSRLDWTKNHSNNTNIDGNNSIITNSLSKENINGSDTKLSNIISKNINNNLTYNNKLEASYQIPLQKNKGGINSQLNLDLAKINIKIGNLQKNIDNNNFINTQLKKLFNMRFFENKVRINQQQLKIAKQQLTLIQTKFEQGLVDKTDVLLQKNNYQNQIINLLSAQQELEAIKQELQNLINKKIQKSEVNLEELATIPQDFNMNDLSAIQIIQLNKNKINRELTSLHNQHKSQMDLSLSASVTKRGNSAFSGTKDNSIGIGLTVDLPLGNSLNNNLITQKLIALEIVKSDEKQTMIEITNTKDTILSQLKTIKNIIGINKQQIKITADQVKEYQEMYDNSNAELNFVIDAENKYQQTQLAYFSNLLQYKNLQLDYQNLLQ